MSLATAVTFIAIAVTLGLRLERPATPDMPGWPLRGTLAPASTKAPWMPATDRDGAAALPAERKPV